MKTPDKTRLTDLVRNLFYETLPLSCLAIVWTIAWASSVVSQVNQQLAPVHHHPIAVRDVPGQPPLITYAGDDTN